MRLLVSLALIIIGYKTSIAQELLINGGAELPLSIGWTQLNPAESWKIDAQRPPHSGSYHFYPENTVLASSELYQDINISGNAVSIDAGTASYTFSGWRRGYKNVSPFSNDMDRSQIIVEYRDASGNILASYDTGSAVFTSWTNNTDTRNAPVGTRTVRIRLISVRVSSSSNNTDDNDGYYDDISFKQNCTAPTSVILTPGTTMAYCAGNAFTISATVSPANANYYYTWYKNSVPITTASKTYAPFTIASSVASDAGIYTLRVEDGNTATATCYKESSVVITIDQPIVAGTISSSQEICFGPGMSTSPLIGTAATGGATIKYYKWQRSTNPAGPWINVNTQPYSTTATGYAVTTGATTYYRRLDSSGTCPVVPTNTVTIRINSKFGLAPITSLLRDTLCIGEDFQLLPPSMGPPFAVSFNGGFYFTWKKVQGTITTTIIPTSIAASPYPTSSRPATIADSGTYYLIAQDGPGATMCKDSVKIVIRVNQSASTKGIIQNNQELCLNNPAILLTQASAGTGAIGSPMYYQWYRTTDTTGTPALTKIPVASGGITYSAGVPLSTFYYVRKDSVKYCAAVKTNFVKIRINNKPVLDSIRATVNDTLCANLSDQFQLKGYIDSITAGKASLNGGYLFAWKKLQQPATIPVVISSTASYTDYPALSRPVLEADSGTYYLYVQDGAGATQCLDYMTLKITVSNNCGTPACIKPTTVSAKIASVSNDTLCVGSGLTIQKDIITLPSTPPVLGYTYSWVRTNTIGTVVVQAASPVYKDLIVASVLPIDSGRYQLIVTDGTSASTSCSERSVPISIVIQNPISSATVGNDTIICKGNTVLPFKELIPNTGGAGNYSHQWQSSANNSSYTNISAATDLNYQSPPILNTTYFRRVDKSGVCAASTSNIIKVEAYTGVAPGSISLNTTSVCYNTIPTQTILSSASATGGTGGSGSEKYQWQQSSDNTTWTPIAGATTLTYKETHALTTVRYYRRQVGMGPGSCDTNYTNSVAINVYAQPNPILTNTDTSICTYQHFTLLANDKASTGSVFQWYKNGTPVSGATNNSYTVSSIDFPGGVYSFEEAISTCTPVASNTTSVTVIAPPAISAGSDFFAGKNTIVMLQGSVNGSTNYSWTPATNLSDPKILTPDARILNTITYTLIATDTTKLCTSQSSVIITMQDAVTIPNVFTPNGDGLNDTWEIEHIDDYPSASCIIYNRWGNVVWKNTNSTVQWNGTNYRNGELLPDGTYFYIIDLKSPIYSEPYTGYIQLIK